MTKQEEIEYLKSQLDETKLKLKKMRMAYGYAKKEQEQLSSTCSAQKKVTKSVVKMLPSIFMLIKTLRREGCQDCQGLTKRLIEEVKAEVINRGPVVLNHLDAEQSYRVIKEINDPRFSTGDIQDHNCLAEDKGKE